MTPHLSDPSQSRAVLVGVHRYERLTDLPAVSANLAGLRGLLLDPGRWGLPQSHCTVLDEPTTSGEVLDILSAEAAAATDTLLFYFAGHGLIDVRNEEELYLALSGADQQRPNRHSIPYSWVRNEFLDAGQVRRKVVILDCCYSGRALGTWMGEAGGDVSPLLDISGTCVLTATARTRRALAPQDQRFTAFTGELIHALLSGVPEGPELLDLDTLYRHVDRRLQARGWPRPKRGVLDNGGLIAIARNVAHGASRAAPAANLPAPRRAPAAPERPPVATRRDPRRGWGEHHRPNPRVRREVQDQEVRRIRAALVDVLERTRVVNDPAGRQLLLDQLRSRLGRLPVREHTMLRHLLVELVHLCGGRDNGLRALTETMELLEPGTAEVRELHRLSAEWEVADLLLDRDWRELRPILSELDAAQVTVEFQQAGYGSEPPPWCASAWHLFVYLASQHPRTEALPPSVHFLTLLEARVDPGTAELLRSRNQHMATVLGSVDALNDLLRRRDTR